MTSTNVVAGSRVGAIGADQEAPRTELIRARPAADRELPPPLPTGRAKRALDVTLVLVSLIVIVPFALVIALAVTATSPGGPFFRQQRLGPDGRPFTMYKFRSMVDNAERIVWTDEGALADYRRNGYKLGPADPRVTPLGRILRRTSLDELPQLYNVLRGDMSLVGPRPVVGEEHRCLYGGGANVLRGTRAGLTGLWQVSGRAEVQGIERANLDYEYVRRQSLWFDVKILLRTVPAVLSSRGAH